MKSILCGVWVQNVVWNFKGHIWNFAQNFEPIHRKICILRSCIFARELRYLWIVTSYVLVRLRYLRLDMEGLLMKFRCIFGIGPWIVYSVLLRSLYAQQYNERNETVSFTPPLKRSRSDSLWKYVNCFSNTIVDIKRLNRNHAAWVNIIENNISWHVFHESVFL